MGTPFSEHTATPWILSEDHHELLDADGELIATAYPMNVGTSAITNAEFLHKAVNHHDALIAVCRDLVAWGDGGRSPVKPLPAILATMRSLLQSATGAPEDVR